METVVLGVRGLPPGEATERVVASLRAVRGVTSVTEQEAGQFEVRYDGRRATVMDLIRAVRAHGYLAGML
ncbi:MAG TPA: heavy-metal-associated domain-containing protein [Deinococcales bacterium]|nr:heavy-metal-associated domain-containing protein [Deinococcales bacterium]